MIVFRRVCPKKFQSFQLVVKLNQVQLVWGHAVRGNEMVDRTSHTGDPCRRKKVKETLMHLESIDFT